MKLNIITRVLLLSTFWITFSCKSQTQNVDTPATTEVTTSQNTNYGDITIEQAKSLIAGNKDLVIIDVRTPQEIAGGKIDGAIEMDFRGSDFKVNLSKLDPNKEYLVYCAAGGRSSNALSMMKDLNITKTYNMLGGYSAWPK